MNFNIFISGDKIEHFYKEALKEYEKRLSKYCKIQCQYFKKYEQLLAKLPNHSYKIFISKNGNKLSSLDLAKKIDTLGIAGVSHICIIICDEISSLPFDEILTISPLDMSLGLNTVILFEQIYRSFRIIHNQAYHK